MAIKLGVEIMGLNNTSLDMCWEVGRGPLKQAMKLEPVTRESVMPAIAFVTLRKGGLFGGAGDLFISAKFSAPAAYWKIGVRVIQLCELRANLELGIPTVVEFVNEACKWAVSPAGHSKFFGVKKARTKATHLESRGSEDEGNPEVVIGYSSRDFTNDWSFLRANWFMGAVEKPEHIGWSHPETGKFVRRTEVYSHTGNSVQGKVPDTDEFKGWDLVRDNGKSLWWMASEKGKEHALNSKLLDKLNPADYGYISPKGSGANINSNPAR